jgi:hypothetical protein
MAQRLHVLLPHVPHVQLSPEQFSVYARKQSQPGDARILMLMSLAFHQLCCWLLTFNFIQTNYVHVYFAHF